MSLITLGSFVFAAPGAVYIWGKNISKKENGIISILGPLTNYVFAIIFIVLGFVFAITLSNKILITIMFIVAQINLFLGAFNLLPIPPLDGFKVFLWNKWLWGALLAIFILTYIIVFVLIF
jgi:Zn-dependent protease